MTTPYFDSQASARSILGDEHLQPDLLLPAQFYARARRILEPEARLLWALLEAGWVELARPKERRAAEIWFANPNYRRPGGFSLSDVCDYFGWDTDTVRNAARIRLSEVGGRENAPGMAPDGGVRPSAAGQQPRTGRFESGHSGQNHPGNRPGSPQEPFSEAQAPSVPRLRACGHPFTWENTTVGKSCRICQRVKDRARHAEQRRRERIARLEEENRRAMG